MRISDWSSDVCSSDLRLDFGAAADAHDPLRRQAEFDQGAPAGVGAIGRQFPVAVTPVVGEGGGVGVTDDGNPVRQAIDRQDDLAEKFARLRVHLARSEEHTSELQSLMRISYAVFCL